MKEYRSWLDRDFKNYDWNEVELSREEVNELNYIDYSYWNELSDGTRKVGRAAKNVLDGKVVFDVPHDRFYSVAKAVETGAALPPIIVVSENNSEVGEIIEGHLRATGYSLAKQANLPLRAIWGRLH